MKTLLGWRGLFAFATIDALFVFAAGSALAAPVGHLSDATPGLPSLLLLGVGTVAFGLGWRRH